MDLKTNREVRDAVREDLRQYDREFFVPADMTDEDVEKLLGDAIRAGIIKKITRVPTVAGRGVGETPGSPGRSPAPKETYVTSDAPASVQIFVQSVGAATPGNGVSSARTGPCRIEQVELFTYADGGALNMPQVFSLHASPSPDLGPFGGDLCVFEYNDPQGLLGIGEGAGLVFYKQRVDTAVGSRVYPRAVYRPNVLIPWYTFYLNATAKNVNHPAACFINVDFAPATVKASRAGASIDVVPRATSTVRTGTTTRAPSVPKTIETRTFQSYAQMKEFEALGNGIVWATVRNTGDPRAPLSASVVLGGSSKGGYFPYAKPTILASGEKEELPGLLRG